MRHLRQCGRKFIIFNIMEKLKALSLMSLVTASEVWSYRGHSIHVFKKIPRSLYDAIHHFMGNWINALRLYHEMELKCLLKFAYARCIVLLKIVTSVSQTYLKITWRWEMKHIEIRYRSAEVDILGVTGNEQTLTHEYYTLTDVYPQHD